MKKQKTSGSEFAENTGMKNPVGDDLEAGCGAWRFEADVPEKFIAHIRQSVPGYDEGHELICSLSDYFCLDESLCYELGTSTGQLIRKLAERNSHRRKIRWIGIDSVPEMIDKAREHCEDHDNIELYSEDIRLYELEKSDFIVSYYTIQFVRPRYRQQVIDKIYQSLNWGGAFLFFEKVRGPDARFQDILTNLYFNYKRQNGFSTEEIMSKADSLKGVLEPFSSQGNHDLLTRAGFVDIMPVFRNICFEGILCIK